MARIERPYLDLDPIAQLADSKQQLDVVVTLGGFATAAKVPASALGLA